MVSFTRAELEGFHGAQVPDLVPEPGQARPVHLLFVGINPGLWTAAVQTHFAHPGNRFYPALLQAGVITQRVDPAAGMTQTDRDHLRARSIAITNLVRRATARADELSADELRSGGQRLRQTIRELRPTVVAVLGITAYRTAFGQRQAAVGRQPEGLEGAELWVAPNPSGLNAHETIATLAVHYAGLAQAAGIDLAAAPAQVRDR